MTFLTAVWNINGGCGKSQTAHHVAITLSRLGKKTLLVAGDPLAPITVSSNQSDEIMQKYRDGLPLKEIAVKTKFPLLDIISARVKNRDSILEIPPIVHPRYNKTLLPKAQLKNWDATIIDVRPSMSWEIVSLILSAKLLIIPVRPDLKSISSMKMSCEHIKQFKGKKPTIWILLLGWKMGRKLENNSIKILQSFSEKNGIIICRPVPNCLTGIY